MASIVMSAPLVVPAVARHTATVIFVHGLGDEGAGWIDLAENWRRRSKFSETKFIFPNAPVIPITVNGGMRMPGWYDIVRRNGTGFGDLQQGQDEVGIMRSRDYLNGLIQKEIAAGVPSERIVLGGFSQGGAMSLFAGVTSTVKLGGIIGLSSYLLLAEKIKSLIPEGNPNKDTPIFMGHGSADPLVLPQWGMKTASILEEMGHKVDFKMYMGLQHSATPQEIDEVETYLKERIPEIGDKASKA